MTRNTDQNSAPGTSLCLTLPDDWFLVDPTDPERSRAQITTMLDARVGDAPWLAEARQVLSDELHAQVRQAAQVDAWLYAFGSLTMFDPPIVVSLVAARFPGTVDGPGLEDLMSTVEDRHPDVRLDLAEAGFGPVLRALRSTQVAEIPMTVAEYWTDPADKKASARSRATLAMLRFTTPTATFDVPLLDFFDAIASTLRPGPATGWQVSEPYPLPQPTWDDNAPDEPREDTP